jgi:hypothetical protein
MTRFLGASLLAVAVLAGFTALPAAARTSVPVIDHENEPVVTLAGGGSTEAQVRQAIEAAGLAREWTIRPVAPGRLLASLTVRNKHEINADIFYSATAYSIRYRDSVNMNFKAGDPATGIAPAIHPHYNRWVDDLNRAIRLSLGKIS